MSHTAATSLPGFIWPSEHSSANPPPDTGSSHSATMAQNTATSSSLQPLSEVVSFEDPTSTRPPSGSSAHLPANPDQQQPSASTLTGGAVPTSAIIDGSPFITIISRTDQNETITGVIFSMPLDKTSDGTVSGLPSFTYSTSNLSPPSTIVTSVITQTTTLSTETPLPVPVPPKTKSVDNEHKTLTAAIVGGVCGGLILVLLVAYAIWHLKTRRGKNRSLIAVGGEPEWSSTHEPKVDDIRPSSALKQTMSSDMRSPRRTNARKHLENRDSIGMTNLEKMQVAKALKWAESEPTSPPPTTLTQRTIGRKPLPRLPVLNERAEETTECSDSSSSEETLVGKDDEDPVSPLWASDSDKTAAQEEYARASPNGSPVKIPVRKLAPGQKYWARLGKTSSKGQ